MIKHILRWAVYYTENMQSRFYHLYLYFKNTYLKLNTEISIQMLSDQIGCITVDLEKATIKPFWLIHTTLACVSHFDDAY